MECDGCTLCCKLLDIPWMDSPSGSLCKHCEEGVGCRIFDHVPKKCKEFRCAYNQAEKASIKFRPDKCHIIFEKVSDTIMYGTSDPQYFLSKDALSQVRSFNNEGYSVIINDRNKLKVFSANNRSIESIAKEYKERVAIRNGITNV